MTQPLFPSTVGTKSHSAQFLTMKTVVKKTENDAQTGPRCLDKAVLAPVGGGGGSGSTTCDAS